MSERRFDYGRWFAERAARVAYPRLARCLNAQAARGDVLDEDAISIEESDDGDFDENVIAVEGLTD